jgi:hypothetical protein
MPSPRKSAAGKTTSRKAPARKASARKASSTKSSTRTSARSRATQSVRARLEQNGRSLGRVKKTLEATQKELTGLSGGLGKDVAKRLKDAGRDVERLNKVVVRDLERLQKDLATAAKGKPSAKKAKPKKAARKAARTPKAKRPHDAKAGPLSRERRSDDQGDSGGPPPLACTSRSPRSSPPGWLWPSGGRRSISVLVEKPRRSGAFP